MRSLGGSILVVVATSVVAHAAPSNPTFLGIGFHSPSGNGTGPCAVDSVNEGSGAKDAGLREQDNIIAVDGVPITNCDSQLSPLITAHQPGDVLRLDLRRGAEHVVINAVLSTRAEVLHRRWVDRPLESFDARALDDGRPYDLVDFGARTTIIGWFDLRVCSDCAQILRRVASVLDSQRGARLVAVSAGTPEELTSYRKGLAVGAPIATVPDEFFKRAALADRDRVQFMVVDAHGVVRFVAPIGADADDSDAAIDELVAAVKQAEHARRR